MKSNKIICIAGQNEIAVNGLKLVIKNFGSANVVACPNPNDLGESNWQPSLKKFASQFGIQIMQLEDLYCYKDLVLISLECSQIIKVEKFKSKKIYNLHFSLLPAYRGVYTSAWPIINQEKITGVTIHKVNKKIDGGNILYQKSFLLKKNDTSRDLYFRYSKYGYLLLKKHIFELVNNNFHGLRQNDKLSSYYSKSSIDYRNIKINLFQNAKNFDSLARALHFREFQLPKVKGVYIKDGLIKTKKNKTGTILKKRESIRISCVDFDIEYKIDRSLEIFQLIKKKFFLSAINLMKRDNSLINVTNKNGWSPLIIAAFNGYKIFAEHLIKLGANVNQANQNGTTVLMYAKEFGLKKKNFFIFKLLIKHGAKLSRRNKFNKNIFNYLSNKDKLLLNNLT